MPQPPSFPGLSCSLLSALPSHPKTWLPTTSMKPSGLSLWLWAIEPLLCLPLPISDVSHLHGEYKAGMPRSPESPSADPCSSISFWRYAGPGKPSLGIPKGQKRLHECPCPHCHFTHICSAGSSWSFWKFWPMVEFFRFKRLRLSIQVSDPVTALASLITWSMCKFHSTLLTFI